MYFQPDVSDEVLRMNTDDIINRTRLMENEIKVCSTEVRIILNKAQLV